MTQAPQLRALSAALGTEALGIDLSKPLEAETLAWIHAAFAEHPVLVFRGQDLGAAELAAFGRRFGVPRPHALTKYRHAECPEVSLTLTLWQITDRRRPSRCAIRRGRQTLRSCAKRLCITAPFSMSCSR